MEAEVELSGAYLEAMGEVLGTAATALEAQIAAINELIASLEAIPPIDFGNLHISNLGGGGGLGDSIANDREQLDRLLADFDLSQLGEVARAFAELNERWDEAAELAHGNAVQLERVAAAREAETAALEAQLRAEVQGRLAAFEPLSQVEKRIPGAHRSVRPIVNRPCRPQSC
jgi:hypothetical protein